MSSDYSKLTSQGQISVPARIRRKLGLHAGSTLQWEEDGERVIVRRAGRFSFEDIHKSLFEQHPKPHTIDDMKGGIRQYIRSRHARR